MCCCCVLKCVEVCCSVSQCVAVCCSVLQCGALQCVALRCVAVFFGFRAVKGVVEYAGDVCHDMCVMKHT